MCTSSRPACFATLSVDVQHNGRLVRAYSMANITAHTGEAFVGHIKTLVPPDSTIVLAHLDAALTCDSLIELQAGAEVAGINVTEALALLRYAFGDHTQPGIHFLEFPYVTAGEPDGNAEQPAGTTHAEAARALTDLIAVDALTVQRIATDLLVASSQAIAGQLSIASAYIPKD